MDAPLLELLKEIAQFGLENDAQAGSREDKMRNITPDTGEFLAVLVRATKARRVLEIGTSNGYSTLWLAEAVRPANGIVTTVEAAEAKAALTRQNFDRAGLSAHLRLQVMDAGAFLTHEPAASFDLVFLDADRSQYLGWWPGIDAVLSPGGVLVVDNAVSHAAEMAPFMELVRGTAGYRCCMVPVGKGEFLAAKAG
jgi:predicted O-methyltransferase YrrM